MDTDPLAVEIGARIRALRIERGMTGAELSGRLMVPSTALTAWERGRVVPSVRTVLLLADALGVAPTALLVGPVDASSVLARVQRLSAPALSALVPLLDLLERVELAPLSGRKLR